MDTPRMLPFEAKGFSVMTQNEATWISSDTPTAIYDPVPGNAASGLYGGECAEPHQLELLVQRALFSLPNVEFSSLEVHRMADGVCLSGVVRVPQNSRPHFEQVAGRAAGVSRVVNRLVVQR
jgi:hypothetical protein